MKTKTIDDKTYYMSDEGMIMFSLHKPNKTNNALDYTTDEMWCVKCMYPSSTLGVWKFFEREDAETWIQMQIDLDLLNTSKRRTEIINPARSVEEIMEDVLRVVAKANQTSYD